MKSSFFHGIAGLVALLFLSFSNLRAQTLPEIDEPVVSKNYFEICAQLDDYFTEEHPDESDCWDNNFVKYQRWKWWWRDRVNPDGSFPELRDQWLETQKLLVKTAQNRDNQPPWQSEGPKFNPNGGYWGMGRTKHVAFHPTNPDIRWVGTPDGGIWKTVNNGLTWNTLGDGLPYLPVSVILVNPQHPDTMYISLGDKGGWWTWNLGVYKSTNGGLSWAPTGLDWKLEEYKVIYNMIMSPSDPQTIFVASNQGILRTKDGGDTWQTLRTGEYTDVEFKPGNDSVVYAAHNDYWNVSQVDKSTDGGDTWTQVSDFQTTMNDLRIAVSPAAPEWLGVHFSNGHQFLLSKDGGHTYTYNTAPEDDSGIFCFSPTDTNAVYLCGVVVSRSLDQGATWEPITHWYDDGVHDVVHADGHDLVLNPYNPNEIWYCNDGGIYRYEEPTKQWTDFSSGLTISQFYRIDVSQNGQVKIAAGSQDNGGWLRTPFGWKHTNGGDAMCQVIDYQTSSTMYTEYYGGNDIYRSDNDFATSVNIADNIPDNPSGDWVTPFLLNPQNHNTFIVGLHDVYRSFDRGGHFHKISENLTNDVGNKLNDIVMAPSDTNVIAASWSSRVFTTTDGGQSWISHLVGSANEGITRVAIHPANPQIMWSTKGGYSDGHKVYKTTNGGDIWVNISENLPNVPTNCILFDSITNYLFLGTDIGVFYSNADSINWEPYGTGMPAVYVLDLKIRNVTRKLYAGTHGRGVFSVKLEEIVGAHDVENGDLAVQVYPNPVKTQLFFKTASAEPFDGMVQLTDALGRVAFSKKMKNMPLRDQVLDIASLPSGLYFMQIIDGSGALQTAEKIIKQ